MPFRFAARRWHEYLASGAITTVSAILVKSHLKFLGHPVHPILVVFLLGLLVTSAIFDGLALATKKPDPARTAHKLIGAGVLSEIIAASSGLGDWLAIPGGTRAKRIGFWHGSGNAVLRLLFTLIWKARHDDPQHPSKTALGLSLSGMMLGNFAAWLGGELTYRLGVGVGVGPGAHLDAPNSLLEP